MSTELPKVAQLLKYSALDIIIDESGSRRKDHQYCWPFMATLRIVHEINPTYCAQIYIRFKRDDGMSQ